MTPFPGLCIYIGRGPANYEDNITGGHYNYTPTHQTYTLHLLVTLASYLATATVDTMVSCCPATAGGCLVSLVSWPLLTTSTNH